MRVSVTIKLQLNNGHVVSHVANVQPTARSLERAYVRFYERTRRDYLSAPVDTTFVMTPGTFVRFGGRFQNDGRTFIDCIGYVQVTR